MKEDQKKMRTRTLKRQVWTDFKVASQKIAWTSKILL